MISDTFAYENSGNIPSDPVIPAMRKFLRPVGGVALKSHNVYIRAQIEASVVTDLNKRILAVSGVAAVLLGVGWWLASARPEAVVSSASDVAVTVGGAKATGARQPASIGDSKLVEIDMMGTKLDAARLFDLGFGGGLNIDQQTRSTLDTLLVAMPEAPSAQDIEKLEWTLRNGLPKDDAEKAIKMFHGYRAYLGDMRGELQQLGIPDTPAAANAYFDQLALVQRRHFDDTTAAALFGQENQNARLVMQAAFISQNEALSAVEKKQQLDLLREQLPQERRHLIPELEPVKP